MTKYHVFFVSTPAIGNLVPIVEFAHRLVHRDRRISATVLIITFSERPILNEYVRSRAASTKEIKFVHLPTEDPLSPDQYQSSLAYLSLFYEKHKSHVKHAITEQSELDAATDTVRIAGLFVDMFSTSMIDVANELGIPSYIFFASPASFLGLMLHLPILDTQLATELVDSETELIIPSFVNPLPHSVLPSIVLERKDAYSCDLVLAEELERGIKLLMDGDGEIGRKVKEMMEKSRMAVMENGSSYVSLGSLIDKLTANN
ncbi:hypothetical protein HS088_TW09G00426 [Tripterygium wilfordii]|uniref:Uncharacterized protein n=1 Tax=Tripterygium wilfordii TaxID=458696 RepID=A0A7J7D7U3_TRIWF|nr:hypothetical protein HS088_TW09G00426 [Tripterygium wilfordii]